MAPAAILMMHQLHHRDNHSDDDESVGPVLLGVTSTLGILGFLSTVLRLVARGGRKMLGWDDYTIAISTLLATTRMVIQCTSVHFGNGKHRVRIAHDDYITINMLGWYTQIFLFSSSCFLKISLCLLLKRIKGDSRRMNIVLYTVMAGLVITNFGIIVILFAQCDPISAYWKTPGVVGLCWPTKVRIYAIYITISYNCFTDFFCSFLPLVIIWKVEVIPLRRKLAVWTLMSLGLVATGFGIARASSLGLKTDDLSWTYAIAAIWSNFELFLGIMAANFALSRFIISYFRRTDDARHGGRKSWKPPTASSRSFRARFPKLKSPWSVLTGTSSTISLDPLSTAKSEATATTTTTTMTMAGMGPGGLEAEVVGKTRTVESVKGIEEVEEGDGGGTDPEKGGM